MSTNEYACICGQYFLWDDEGANSLACPECGSGDVLVSTRGRTSDSEPPPEPDPPAETEGTGAGGAFHCKTCGRKFQPGEECPGECPGCGHITPPWWGVGGQDPNPPPEVAKPHDTEPRTLQDYRRGLEMLAPGFDIIQPPRPPDIAILRPGTPCEIGPTDDPLTGTVSAVSIYPNDRVSIQVAWWSGREHHEEWLESHEVRECAESRRCTVGLARAMPGEQANEE